MLCKLAEQHHIHITGDERTGSFSGRGVEGDFQISEQNIRGAFASHGVKGVFAFQIGEATLTVTDKPFWLPEVLLKQKITGGLNSLCDEVLK
jgi:hypothetical protein